MLRPDVQTEVFRRAGLFCGAAMLGLLLGQGIAHAGEGFVVLSSPFPPAFNLLLAIAGLVVGFRLRSHLLRAAWVVFSTEHLVLSLRPFGESPQGAWLETGSNTIFAVLLVVAGARRRTSRALALAVAIFMASVGLQMGLTEWSKRLRGLHSVVSLQLRRT